MQHSRRGDDDHGTRIVGVTPIKGFYVFKLEHVSLDESVFNLLIRPSNKHLVKVVGLFRQTQGEVDWSGQIHPFPVRLQKDA